MTEKKTAEEILHEHIDKESMDELSVNVWPDILEAMEAYAAQQKSEIAQRCPVCGGNGMVPNGFYNTVTGIGSTTSIVPETCRSCNGTGVIFAALHAQKIADKMVEERLKNAPKNCPKAAQCAHVEGGMKCPPNVICPI